MAPYSPTFKNIDQPQCPSNHFPVLTGCLGRLLNRILESRVNYSGMEYMNHTGLMIKTDKI